MGLGDILRRVFLGKDAGVKAGGNPYAQMPAVRVQGTPGRARKDQAELGRRIGLSPERLGQFPVSYSEFKVPKRSGGVRTIQAPSRELKAVQRAILRRLLGRLKAHPAAAGFERGLSIVANARCHVRQAVVLRMDIRDFFGSTTDTRVGDYFRSIGWDAHAADALVALCTWKGSLPQGAVTSPRLSNLVNYRLDERLARLAAKFNAVYTRYADDMTFSFSNDDMSSARSIIRAVKTILAEYGYHLHTKRKLHICRKHRRQTVTGLVVNEKVQLPRATRRFLRAVRHRLRAGRAATLSPVQLAGWDALESMIREQARDGEDRPPGVSPMQ